MKIAALLFCSFLSFYSLLGAEGEIVVAVAKRLSQTSSDIEVEAVARHVILVELKPKTAEEKSEILKKLLEDPLVQKYPIALLEFGISSAENLATLGNYQEALKHYHQSLSLAENQNLPIYQARINTGIATEYFFLEKYDSAMSHFKSALFLNQRYRDSAEVAGSYSNIGTVYSRKNEADSAIHYLNLGLNYFISLQDSMKIAQTLNNLGNIYQRNLNKTLVALPFFQEALDIHKKTGNRYEEGVSSLNLAVIYYELGRTREGLELLHEAFKKARETRNIPLQKMSLKNLAQMYEEIGTLDSALHYTKAYHKFSDSLNLIQQKTAIAEMEQTFLLEQEIQQKEIQALKIDALYKWIIIAILLIFLLFSLVLYVARQKRQKQKLEEIKSNFYANLAHEFRTPVSLIKSPAEQLYREFQDEKIKNRSAIILKNADRLLDLFNQLLDVSKLESNAIQSKLVYGDLVNAIQDVLVNFQEKAVQKQIQLEFVSDKKELMAEFDADVLQKSLSNLIDNAIKFSNHDSVIQVEVKTMHMPDKKLKIRVQDFGTGIDQEAIKRLFKRFNTHRTEKNNFGVGLGLALSKDLLNNIGGDLILEKTSAQGTTFLITMPYLMVAMKHPVEEDDYLEKISVLFVDDNEDILSYLLQEFGGNYKCLRASNGQDALEIAAEQVPDIVVSDLMMPVMDGIEFTKALRANEITEHIPVILLSAKQANETKHLGLTSGAIHYMTKPFDVEALKQQVNNYLDWRLTLKSKFLEINKDSQRTKLEFIHHEHNFIQKIVVAVSDNLNDEAFGVHDLSEILALSRAQVHRKIKALTGLSTSTLIRCIRLEQAHLLLSESKDMNVSEVAYACGFSSLSYFSKSYSAYFGVNPSSVK